MNGSEQTSKQTLHIHAADDSQSRRHLHARIQLSADTTETCMLFNRVPGLREIIP